MAPSDKSTLTLMTDSGIPPCKIIDYLQNLAGGTGKLKFRRKDVYKFTYKKRCEMISAGDVNTALSLLEGMKIHDQGLVVKHIVDEFGALTRMFWCDSMSKAEYEAFGDVLLFNNTYKINTYRFPLVIFCGADNHSGTCIFGTSILYSETIESYRWLLRTFIDAMSGKLPVAVLTDQDKSMYAAIKFELPGVRHRLCGWHLGKNASKCCRVGDFPTKFCSLMRKVCSVEEFEEAWSNLVEEYGVAKKEWVVEVNEIKHMWAEAYFVSTFLGGMRTTQRLESMNNFLKLFVKPSFSLTEFIKHYHRTIQKMRPDFREKQLGVELRKPVVHESSLKDFERQAADISTKKVFWLVRAEILAEQEFLPVSKTLIPDQKYEFVFCSFKHQQGRHFSVCIDLESHKYECSCMLFKSEGLPCRHLLSAFKSIGLTSFPEKSIAERWLIETGSKLEKISAAPFPLANTQEKRFGKLHKEYIDICHIASKTEFGCQIASEKMKRIAKEIEEEMRAHCVNGEETRNPDDGLCNDSCKEQFSVNDPPRV